MAIILHRVQDNDGLFAALEAVHRVDANPLPDAHVLRHLANQAGLGAVRADYANPLHLFAAGIKLQQIAGQDSRYEGMVEIEAPPYTSWLPQGLALRVDQNQLVPLKESRSRSPRCPAHF